MILVYYSRVDLISMTRNPLPFLNIYTNRLTDLDVPLDVKHIILGTFVAANHFDCTKTLNLTQQCIRIITQNINILKTNPGLVALNNVQP